MYILYCRVLNGYKKISIDGRFEWDENKSRINKELHGLCFDEILPAFDDPFLLEVYDKIHSTITESRFKGLAEMQDFIILYLSYTEPISGRTRIISARLAEPAEEKMYYEWKKNFIS
jgi:uncharacterized DUF497 family protein